jgi:hypothetical protein
MDSTEPFYYNSINKIVNTVDLNTQLSHINSYDKDKLSESKIHEHKSKKIIDKKNYKN